MVREKVLIAVAAALVGAGGTALAYDEVKSSDPQKLYSLVRESDLDSEQKDFLVDVLVAATYQGDAEVRAGILRSIDRQMLLKRQELDRIREEIPRYPNLEPNLRRMEKQVSGFVAAREHVVDLLNRQELPQEELNAEFVRIVSLLRDPPDLEEVAPASPEPAATPEQEPAVVEARAQVRQAYWWGVAKEAGGVATAGISTLVVLLAAASSLLDIRKKWRADREERRGKIIVP